MRLGVTGGTHLVYDMVINSAVLIYAGLMYLVGGLLSDRSWHAHMPCLRLYNILAEFSISLRKIETRESDNNALQLTFRVQLALTSAKS